MNILRNGGCHEHQPNQLVLRNNDVILSVDGVKVNEANHLQERVALRRPGEGSKPWKYGVLVLPPYIQRTPLLLNGLEN